MTEQGGLVRAKVARLLNSTDLALNRGENDGVGVGTRFAILDRRGHEIVDPDTHEVLDSVQIAKTLVKVVSVTPRLAVARTFRTKRAGMPGFAGLDFTARDRTETLRSDANRLQQELDPRDSYIKVGDEAIEYRGDFDGIVFEF
jgi:hypothetical protein